MAACTRLRSRSLFMRFCTWVLTVCSERLRERAISPLDMPPHEEVQDLALPPREVLGADLRDLRASGCPMGQRFLSPGQGVAYGGEDDGGRELSGRRRGGQVAVGPGGGRFGGRSTDGDQRDGVTRVGNGDVLRCEAGSAVDDDDVGPRFAGRAHAVLWGADVAHDVDFGPSFEERPDLRARASGSPPMTPTLTTPSVVGPGSAAVARAPSGAGRCGVRGPGSTCRVARFSKASSSQSRSPPWSTRVRVGA